MSRPPFKPEIIKDATIAVRGEPGMAPLSVPVVAYTTPAPGLMVHCKKRDGSETWCLSHVQSGFTLSSSFATLDAAITAARKLVSVADWTWPRYQIEQRKDVLKRMRRILHR